MRTACPRLCVRLAVWFGPADALVAVGRAPASAQCPSGPESPRFVRQHWTAQSLDNPSSLGRSMGPPPSNPPMKHILLLAFVGIGSLGALPPSLCGQSVINWSDFRRCGPCNLTVERILAFGDRAGPGAIRSDLMVLTGRSGQGFILHALPGVTLSLFDDRGRFVRTMGREGQGPGEFTGLMGAAFTARGTIVASDYSGRWSTFTREGRLLGEARLEGVAPGEFQLATDGAAALVAKIDSRADAVGFPLHRVDLATGRVLARLGAKDPVAWSPAEPMGTAISMGRDEWVGSSAWWGKRGRPYLEEWSLDGSPLRVLTGELAWFPPMTRTGRRDGSPWNIMIDFAVDDQDRLWLVTHVADRRWREVGRGSEGSIPQDQIGTYWDSRLDLFDLRGMRHIGFHLFDPAEVRLLKRDGKVFAYFVEYETPTWPRMAIYRIDGPPAQPRR